MKEPKMKTSLITHALLFAVLTSTSLIVGYCYGDRTTHDKQVELEYLRQFKSNFDGIKAQEERMRAWEAEQYAEVHWELSKCQADHENSKSATATLNLGVIPMAPPSYKEGSQ